MLSKPQEFSAQEIEDGLERAVTGVRGSICLAAAWSTIAGRLYAQDPDFQNVSEDLKEFISQISSLGLVHAQALDDLAREIKAAEAATASPFGQYL